MHPSSFDNMKRCVDRLIPEAFFSAAAPRKVVEIGSCDFNGGYRPIFAGLNVAYTGVDMSAGPGVDIVLSDPYALPFETGSVDLVVSGQMLEHCEYFWLAFQEMIRVLTPTGYLILIAPSGGPIHRYPVDCYRFYPDAFASLAKLAGCTVVSIRRDERGPWCDLVGVFSKAPEAAGMVERPVKIEVQNRGAFRSTPELDAVAGREDYLLTLERIHGAVAPRAYLEIGVRSGLSLALAKCPSIGVDPDPAHDLRPPEGFRLHQTTSDDFFETAAEEALRDHPIDLAFIDGMHMFEFAMRDFMNIERHAHPATVVVIDDILPNHPDQATRTRTTRYWSGDVWRFADILARRRPDLTLIRLDTVPTGLLVVVGLNPVNRVLWESYNPLVTHYLNSPQTQEPPASVLTREGVHDPRSPTVVALLEAMAAARDKPNVRPLVQRALQQFRADVAAAARTA